MTDHIEAIRKALEDEREFLATEARRYASHYPEASDGRNTFIIFAEMIERRSALVSPADTSPERYRHKKRRTIYDVIACGRLQVDGDLDNEKVVIYRGEDGQTWVRPEYEFNDGRFEPLAAAPKEANHDGD